MKVEKTLLSRRVIAGIMIVFGAVFVATTVFAVTTSVTSSVTVSNAAPTVSGVTLNGGGAITLIANATTSVNVVATISDNNGCSDVNNGTTTILLYRNSVGSSTCLTTPNDLNCYRAIAFTASSTCTVNSVTATTTFGVNYFAAASDWRATVIFKDPSNTTGSADSATSTVNTLTAINVTTSSIVYGSLAPSSTSTVSTTSVANAGNSSSTLQLNASPTLTSGGNTIATSSQHYATSSFTYGGSEQQLQTSATAVPGFTLIAPTTTTNVVGNIFWALQVPVNTATGTYSGTNVFTAAFTP